MAQSGYTPILIYASGTTGNTPSASNLTSSASGSELALNYFDGKLFYKDASGNVQVLASKAGNVNVASFSAGTTGFTPSSATTGAVTLAGTLATTNGGTGLTSFTANQVFYASSTSAFAQSTNLQFNGTTLTVANDASISGLTIGKGGGSVSTNTAVGAQALNATATGGGNTGVGYQADASITTGTSNSAFGQFALTSNSTGSSNTGIGAQALNSNTTASHNTAVGYQAGYSNQIGGSNTYIGEFAGFTANPASSSDTFNTFVGRTAGYATTTGTYNTFVGPGSGAGFLVTTGSKNTVLGGYNGNQGGLDIRTASNNVVLSDGDGNVAGRWANGGGWYQLNNSASWSTTSDARIKEKVETIVNGLDVVMALRPVEFDYKISQKHTAGFIAQEYETVLPDQIIEDSNISDELKALTNGEPLKGIQQNLVPYLVSAIQALKAEFDAYKVSHP